MMRSKTFSYPKHLFKKNLTRFAPLWGLYLLGMSMLVLLLLGQRSDYYIVSEFTGLIHSMALFSGLYAFLTTQALFGDLFTTRMCYGLASLPVRREGVYGAGVAAGLLFSLVPTVPVALLAAFLLSRTPVENAAMLGFYWWIVANGQYLFFFAVGVCCVMLAGNRLGQMALYGLVNLGSVFLYLLIDNLYTPLVYGVLLDSDPFTRFSPVIHMTMGKSLFIDLEYYEIPLSATEVLGAGRYTLASCWSYLGITAALGLVLLGVGLVLYRRRNLECAGDFLADRRMDGLVQVCLSLMSGAVVAFFGKEIVGQSQSVYWCLAVGMLVGWFVGKMFLERSTAVFTLRSWRGLGLLGVIVAVSLTVTKLDPMGIRVRVPETDEIASIMLDTSVPVEPERFEDVRLFHQQALNYPLTRADFAAANREDMYNSMRYYSDFTLGEQQYVSMRITYTLKNGSKLDRRYPVPLGSDASESMRSLQSSITYALRYYGSGRYKEGVLTEADVMAMSSPPRRIEAGDVSLPLDLMNKETVDKLLTAFLQDVADGNGSPNGIFHPKLELPNQEDRYAQFTLWFEPEDREKDYIHIPFFLDSKNILAALEELGVTREMLIKPLLPDEGHPRG